MALPATQVRLALPTAFKTQKSDASCSFASMAPSRRSKCFEGMFCLDSKFLLSRPANWHSNAKLRFTPRAQSISSSGKETDLELEEGSVSLVLLAGGVGKRMGASMPKQYLPLLDKPIALHSFETFCGLPEIGEIIVVCDPSYRDVFQNAFPFCGKELKFALPGKERQDSTFNGLNSVRTGSKLVAIHDSARPLITALHAKQVLLDAKKHGAATLGVPVKATIKQVNGDGFVTQTLDRRILWEIQTPQVIEPELLKKGFAHVKANDLEVTDDVSIVEYLDQNVFITHGCYTNLKVTTPEDLLLAEKLLISKEIEEKSVAVQ